MTSNKPLSSKGPSLNVQLARDAQSQHAQLRQEPREKSKRQQKRAADAEDDDGVIKISQKESAKILELARNQLVAVESNLDDDAVRKKKQMRKSKQREEDDSSIDDDDSKEDVRSEDEDDNEEDADEGQNVFAEIDEDDERAIAAFSRKTTGPAQSASSTAPRKTLGEIILEKLAEEKARREREANGEVSETKSRNGPSHQLNPQVVEVYTSVGVLMTRYRSGKVPKAFKIIPALKDWEDVLALTHPEKWSPQAMYQATRLFASNMNPRMAQRFYSSVLLPAIREDIQANRSLNYHLYMSIKKSIYKPASFFKGILFPLVEEECTLREAAIVGSVLAKVSIPVVHSGAALYKLSQMPYNGSTSVFLRVLINKKYSLPYKVVDTLVDHFCSFTDEERQLPVLWHQALLVLVQRYRNVFSQDQRERLRTLLKKQNHKQLTGEIRRELFQDSNKQ